MTLYRCQGNYYCSKNKLYATQCYSDVLTIFNKLTTPLGKLHRDVADVLTVYLYDH